MKPSRPQHFNPTHLAALLLGLLGLLAACGTPGPLAPAYQPRTPEARDRILAEDLCDQAEPLMATDPDRAEQLLVEAVTADLYSGRARNNLGVLYLQRGALYQAAGEFELARKLLPDNPDPRINLGLTLERAGRVDDALDAYAAAYDLQPQHLGAMQALARAQLRYSRVDDRTQTLLDDIALRGDDHWRSWAVAQRLRQAP